MNQPEIANIAYLLCALVLAGMAAAGASRRAKAVGAKGPGVVTSLLIWFALIALIAALYFGAQVWGALFSTVT